MSGEPADPHLGPLVETWLTGLAHAMSPSMPPAELRRFLTDAAARLVRAGLTGSPDPDEVAGVGASLVHAGLITPEVFPATVAALGRHLGQALEAGGAPAPGDAAARLVTLIAEGYARALPAHAPDGWLAGRHDPDVSPAVRYALRTGEARFRAVFAHAGTGIIIGDPYGRLIEANAAYADMLGYRVEELRGRDVRELIHPDEAPSMMDMYRSMNEEGIDEHRFIRRYLHRDGHVVLAELTTTIVRDEEGAHIMTVAVVVDITRREQLQKQLRHQAQHDPLTGLPNRSLFAERLGELFARRAGRVGLCYLDLDRFKAVNDRLGHDVGDQLLVVLAERIGDVVTGLDRMVARMGGDEFVVVVPDPVPGELVALAEEILAALVDPFDVAEHRLTVSASIGLVESDVVDTDPASLVKSADVTLYWAKADGRARWAIFDVERNAREMARYTVLATLAQGVERGEFRVVYQPIVELTDGRVRGVEALVRWEHPTLGYLTPDQFIGPAEDNGMIVPLGRSVLAEACAEIAAWNADRPGRPLYASVNLAARQAAEPDLAEVVAQILDETGLPARLLQLEVTESDLLDPAGRQVDAIVTLAAMGVRFAVDDFGSGYSNLGYLPRLPLHTLKITGSLVAGIRDRVAGAGPIVANLVRLAHELGLQVTAEEVETPEQARWLVGCGCDSAQGWLYAKAAPLITLADLIERRQLMG